MAFNPNQQTNTGSFVPISIIFDATALLSAEVTSPEFKQLLVRLYQAVNNISIVINTKESGYYPTEEFVTGALYYNPTSTAITDFRGVFRSTFNTGALGAGVTNVAHALVIDASWHFVRIYGAATDNVGNNYVPLPFVDAAGVANIEVTVDAVNIVITNNSGIAFTSSSIVLEYVKT